MKIAFWNVNLGTSSFSARREVFSAWCEAVKPDLLVLEEVSYTMFYPPGEAGPRRPNAAKAREEAEIQKVMARRLAESPRKEKVDPSVVEFWSHFRHGDFENDSGSEYPEDGSSSLDTSLDTSLDASLDTSTSHDTSVDASSSDDVSTEERDAGKEKGKEKEKEVDEEELELEEEELELEEVELRMADEGKWKKSQVEEESGMSMLVNCFMLDRNMSVSTKCLAALGKKGRFTFASRALMTRSKRAKRMGLKISSTEEIVVWGIHANASTKGGEAAVEKAVSSVNAIGGRLMLWGGDFNRAIGDAKRDGGRVCHPLAHDGSKLNFTQWAHEQRGSTGRGYSQKLHLPEGKALSFPVDPHGVIDYVIHGKGLEVTAEPNCPTVEMWCEILAQFDHCPVVYTVTKKGT